MKGYDGITCEFLGNMGYVYSIPPMYRHIVQMLLYDSGHPCRINQAMTQSEHDKPCWMHFDAILAGGA